MTKVFDESTHDLHALPLTERLFNGNLVRNRDGRAAMDLSLALGLRCRYGRGVVFAMLTMLGMGVRPSAAAGQEGGDVPSEFRVLPYLLHPAEDGMTVNWFTEDPEPGRLWVRRENSADSLRHESTPRLMEALRYSELEEAERGEFPDMFANRNYKHSIRLSGLEPGATYEYRAAQGGAVHSGRFRTAPPADGTRGVRFITLADSETDYEGRTTHRDWAAGAQATGSTGRPDSVDQYLLTEAEGYRHNLAAIRARDPDFLLLSGDVVQGGGYQRAWDEFFFHNAGKVDDLLSYVPLIPAIGNWENFGARNGGYEPWAIAASRAKYAAYFDAPPNNNPAYRNFYYRIDYGPVTVLTLDSSNGLPDNTDQDTNVNIDAAAYPGDDLPDFNPGSDQWRWTIEQLADAREQGQVIFVQFHHIPYSSGGHSLPLTAEGSSGQAGIPMRVYTPLFKEYGVAAVFCGHSESFEHSLVDGIHFYDVGVAGDGLGYAIDDRDPRRRNPYRVWVAHHDARELWEGNKLVDGGKHYGHLEVSVEPVASARGRFSIRMVPAYLFPVTDDRGEVVDVERRVYDDIVEFTYDPSNENIVPDS